MRHIIDEEKRKIIEGYIGNDRGARARFCKKNGIKTAALSQILTGKRKVLYDDLWYRIVENVPMLQELNETSDQNEYTPKRMTLDEWRRRTGNYPPCPQGSSESNAVEHFRQGLITQFVLADIEPREKDKAMRIVVEYKKQKNPEEK